MLKPSPFYCGGGVAVGGGGINALLLPEYHFLFLKRKWAFRLRISFELRYFPYYAVTIATVIRRQHKRSKEGD